MSFNPAIFNEGGIYRHSDFVGYLPDFLKTEPDVVTLMQVFSDYINNAYRNIETTNEFEVMRVCPSSSKQSVQNAMESLQSMFVLAYSRSESVLLVSAPRNNVKNDNVMGNAGAEYPIELEIPSYTDVQDVFHDARSLGIGKYCYDGAVVYIKYTSMNPVQVVPYYYEEGSNTLQREPKGSSQDPFTGTLNTPDRIIQFKVDDVGTVCTRYATTVNNNDYFEIYFKLKVSNIEDVPNVDTTVIDGEGIEGSSKDIVVDYCNVKNVSKEKYRAIIKFAGEHGFEWSNGFPCGIFYFKESSAAKLVSLGDMNSILCQDPALSPSIERYRITGLECRGTLLTVYTDNFPGLYDYAMCYIVDRSTGATWNYRMDASTESIEVFDTGSRYVVLVSMDGFDGTGLIERVQRKDLDIVIVPLFYDKKVIDYSTATPMVKWDYQYPEYGYKAIDSDSMYMYGTKITDNKKVADITPCADNCTGNMFFLPDGFALELNDYVYCDNGMWSGIARIDDISTITNEDGFYRYTLGDNKLVTSASYGVKGSIYKIVSGIGQVDLDDNTVIHGRWDIEYSEGDYVLLEPFNKTADPTLIKISEVDNDNFMMKFDVTDFGVGVSYIITRVEIDDTATITKFAYRKLGTEYTTGVVGSENGGKASYVGDVFSQTYMLGYSMEMHSFSLFHMVTDVYPNAEGSYRKGDFVAEGGKVYRALKDAVITEGSSPSRTDGFVQDNIEHFAVGFKKLRNVFMPYYGPYTSLDYGERPNYTTGLDAALVPLYIRKITDTRLRYGWQDREYMYYGNQMDITTRPRNGYVEFYSTGMNHDIVNNDLAQYASGVFDYPVVKSGVERYMEIDIDSTLTAINNFDGSWTISVRSAEHGLVEGAEVRVTCADSSKEITAVFAETHAIVHVVDSDNFEYTTEPVDEGGNPLDIAVSTLACNVSSVSIVYCRDCRYSISGIKTGTDSYVRIELSGFAEYDISGREIELSDCVVYSPYLEGDAEVDISGTYTVVDDPNPTSSDYDKYICLKNVWGLTKNTIYATVDSNARVLVPIAEGDLLFDGTHIYKVNSGIWTEMDRTSLGIPFTIFSRNNYFDISDTNPGRGRGDTYVIKSIVPTEDGTVLVTMSNPLEFVSIGNHHLIEGKTEVFIENVYPTYYTGWHTISKVYSGGVFEINVRDVESELTKGIPVENRQMQLRPGTWYRYTVDAYDWDKISNQATYATSNTVINIRKGDPDIGEALNTVFVYTKDAHGFKAGDDIVFDMTGTGCHALDQYSVHSAAGYFNRARVAKVYTDTVFTIVDDGRAVETFANAGVSTVFKGYVFGLDGTTYDDIELMSGEYARRMHGYDNRMIRFTDGDIVIAAAQINANEIGAWRVSTTSWIPVRKKRVLKIRNISVEMYPNPEYNGFDDTDDATEFKYRCYNEVDIYNADIPNSLYYMLPARFSRNFSFTEIALENMDTTRHVLTEYNAKYDFGTIAPRDFDDTTFKGVPDMKYPLVEKLERLSYLKDMSVLDIDLIGYLARYMGYDITSLSSDIDESSVYSTQEQREKALRSTIENLPQYYALGGTRAGIDMLLATFGIIGKVLTKWTNTERPYKELLYKSAVDARIDADNISGTHSGNWVPTPHIDVEIPMGGNFRNMLNNSKDLNTLIEQIRVVKPINVVFDDIILTVKTIVDVGVGIRGSAGAGSSGNCPVLTDDVEGSVLEATGINYDVCDTLNCVF